MRFAAYSKCGDVTATTVPADQTLIRTWPVKVIGRPAERASRHLRDHHPGAREAARRRNKNGNELPSNTTRTAEL